MLDTFRDRLVWLRVAAGTPSPRDVAKAAGLSPSHIGMLESGQRPRPEAKTVADIAGVYGVSSDWLVLGKGKRPNPDDVKLAFAKARKAA